MTADEVLTICAAAMTAPQGRLAKRIGIPREGAVGGAVMRMIAAAAGNLASGDDGLRAGPMFCLTRAQMMLLGAELRRPLCNSGDLLFGKILIGMFEPGERLDEFEGDMVDLRGNLSG